ncbi:hypothetical protein D3C79_905650 [compost metagenome]
MLVRKLLPVPGFIFLAGKLALHPAQPGPRFLKSAAQRGSFRLGLLQTLTQLFQLFMKQRSQFGSRLQLTL